jgi:Rrf2 family transcriptional regulator, iron-sulfur cluster assembly transcription factor
MVFSKSFGYALRGILYVAAIGGPDKKIHLNRIAEELSVPKHFLGKIMRNMAKQGIVSSDKGSRGGFYINDTTLKTSLKKLVEVTGETDEPGTCVLRLRKCTGADPCPLHKDIELLRNDWQTLLTNTTLQDLLNKDSSVLIRSITIQTK